MSKINLFFCFFFATSILMAGCESYNLEAGKVPGALPGQATKSVEAQHVNCGSDPNVLCVTNSSPQTPKPPQLTAVPTQSFSHTKQSGKTDQATDWIIYRDSVYAFQIAYPPQFTFEDWEKADLAAMKPEPVAGIKYFDPSMNLGVISSSYLVIRIYDMGKETSVEAWLKANGLYLPEDGWTIVNYQGEHFSGYQVNSSLYMAPGIFYYAAKGKFLYQLTPLGQDAEQMLTTFEFIQ